MSTRSGCIKALNPTLRLGPWGAFVVSLGLLNGACSKKEQPAAPAPSIATSTAAATAAKPALPPLPEPPLGPLRIPADNPVTADKVRLGQRLFFDKRLSSDGSRACYDCHKNEDGTGGHDPLAMGVGNKPQPRHAPTLWNVAYLPKLTWDGRADSLEAQFKGAWSGGNMGVGPDNMVKKADEIGALPEYQADFDRIFPALGATPDTIAQAVASYERTLFCSDTAWDSFMTGSDGALTAEQKQGWELFKGKAMCTNCHVAPFFSDAYLGEAGAFHNTGKGTQGKPESEVDPGRMKVTQNAADWAAFKTPSLRNVASSAPYFHDGSVATLKEAVTFMASGGAKNKNRDPRLADKKLTPPEIDSIVAFLGSLQCNGKLLPPTN